MRILLVGEYSNLHNSLKSGLLEVGHQVTLISTGDAFKKLPADILFSAKRIENNSIMRFLQKAIFKVFRFDIAFLEIGYRCLDWLVDQKKYDVIQLINEYPFKTPYFLEKKIIKRLRNLTHRLVVLACGDDYIYLKNIDKLPYHPILQHPDIDFPFSKKYLTIRHKKYHDFVFQQKDLIISSDLDYHPIYKGVKDYYGLIPNPVNLSNFQLKPQKESSKIIIFHGVNRTNYHKKGNDFFDAALAIIQQKYQDQIEVISVTTIPYAEYIQTYKKADIILDQTYALDQGYNALEAMAQGKVVLTGAGKLFCKTYNLEPNSIAIHTIPDAERIAADLEELILNPNRIREIGLAARLFIKKHHNYKIISKKYVEAWNSITAKADESSASVDAQNSDTKPHKPIESI
ncbi:glycosyltransferase involved in cell wall biosynthesis [Leeuwenhoekiella aestuarii]|uniref:Glycosyltransferase involved in cell wall biosynthesis n=1 Tax=Leeuwenhoekiella aestuarii TaxID=2249426 RepID=A0A4Q0NRN6_9FLAO|nr:glycosyltransferase [Leeuwenhoekiella aestuarii]RXG13342.1 glycosyltransferase involved in cell wall biosynthesis [Leeuwenhoekiella aestuarii]RXG14927.1 glycosyltransferase involved in cell wall biosynthesis [Leeuwenhoekiella aestuarii]